MQVNRFVAFYQGDGEPIYRVQLPHDCFPFLQGLDYLKSDNDPLLYCNYELTEEEAAQIMMLVDGGSHDYWLALKAEYFTFVLECDRVDEDHTKTRDQLYAFTEHYCIDFVTSITGDSDVTAAYRQDFRELQELLYKIYQQGVIDGRL